MKKICFIFARGGSTRLKNKNIKMFNKKPLIYYSINIAKKTKLFSDIYVSTDSIKILKLAKKYGAKTIKRPKKLATKDAVEFLAWKHAIEHLESKKIYFDTFVSLPCTAPLRNTQDISNCISNLTTKNQLVMTFYYGDLNSGLKVKKSKNQINYIFSKYNHDKSKKIAQLTTVAYVTTPKYIKKYKNLMDGELILTKVPRIRATDINDYEDFKFAEDISRRINL
jgi:CMP-N-acetylneuraminic acid synthetase